MKTAIAIAAIALCSVLCGCKSDRQLPSGDSYPGYNCWWR